MRGAAGGRLVRRATQVLLAAGLALALAACSAAGAESTAVPTFPAPTERGGPTSGPADDGDVVPADCTRILGAPDLEALLGLPLGSVALRTTVGVAEPSVGRTERVSCRYTRIGGSGRPLLDINATAYRDADAALKQWQVNVGAESGERREMRLGSASAVQFEQRDEGLLMVAHATSNLTLVLPDQPLPGGRSRGDVLVDLALRVLPAVSVETTPPPPPTGPLPQAGAAR